MADQLIGGSPGLGFFQLSLVATGLGFSLIAMLPASAALRLILIAGGTASGLLLAEFAIRLFFNDDLKTNLRLHPRYLFQLIPGSSKYVSREPVNGGQRILVRVNSTGYRGEELRPRGAAHRVVVYGDSFIEGEFSELDSTFARRLERALVSRVATPVEVINAGVRGYGPDQVVLRMEDELPALEPDLVIVSIFAGNDFGDLLRNKLFGLGPANSLLSHTVTIADSIVEQFKVAQPGGLALLRLVGKLRSPTLARALPGDEVEEWVREKQRQYLDATSEGGWVLTTPLEDHYDVDISTAPASPAARYQARLMQAVLRRIRDIADRNDCPLLVMIIPALTDLCAACGAEAMAIRFPAYHTRALTDLVQESAQREHVRYVNLYTPDWEAQGPGLYFRGGDEHWNDRGQAIAGELIAQYIVDHDLLRRAR